MFDAIIVGSRCAGAPTAMLLARRGRRVLVVDRAQFPSDVLSGHAIQPDGVARLARWGLLDRVLATGTPPLDRVRFDFGPVVLEGSPVAVDGIDALLSVRRTILDPLLADAAEEAGAEVRFGVTVDELIVEGGAVAGVRGRDAHGRRFEERARIVIGADGARSFVARAVDAPMRIRRPATTSAIYSYWSGLDVDRVELSVRPGRFFVATPTNDDLAFVTVQMPVAEADANRHRVEDSFLESIAALPAFAERLRGATRVERFRFAKLPDSFVRRPYGPGWALVGDAACHKDPVTAQGMLDAFRDAELLATALDAGLDGDLAGGLAGYEAARDAASLPMFEHTCRLADLETPPPTEMLELIGALQGQPEHIARFLGVTAGTVAVPDFFSPESIGAVMGGLAA